MIKSIWEFLKEIFRPLDDEEAWEVGVITPKLRKEPTTEPRLKAMVPENKFKELREQEIIEAQSRADEAGVVPPR